MVSHVNGFRVRIWGDKVGTAKYGDWPRWKKLVAEPPTPVAEGEAPAELGAMGDAALISNLGDAIGKTNAGLAGRVDGAVPPAAKVAPKVAGTADQFVVDRAKANVAWVPDFFEQYITVVPSGGSGIKHHWVDLAMQGHVGSNPAAMAVSASMMPSVPGVAFDLQCFPDKPPCQLWLCTLQEVSTSLASKGSVTGDIPCMTSYFNICLKAGYPDMNKRTWQELKTLAVILDALGNGSPATRGDVAIQRWKALGQSLEDKTWVLAHHHALTGSSKLSLISNQEKLRAGQPELTNIKLLEHAKNAAKKSGSG